MSQDICTLINDANCKNLCSIQETSLDYFNFAGKKFSVKPCHIYDGDTFSAIFNFNGQVIKYKCRCVGYDCAEMKPLKSDPNRDKEKELAKAAKERFIQLVTANPSGLCVIECGIFDKYGRILVTVYNGINKESINELMIKEGHGKPYEGGTKDAW